MICVLSTKPINSPETDSSIIVKYLNTKGHTFVRKPFYIFFVSTSTVTNSYVSFYTCSNKTVNYILKYHIHHITLQAHVIIIMKDRLSLFFNRFENN